MIGVCRYCGCTDETPCVSIQKLPGSPSTLIPCAWLLEDVCDAPPCVEKAYFDERNSAEQLTHLLDEGIRIEFEDVA